jgi:TonB family protein
MYSRAMGFDGRRGLVVFMTMLGACAHPPPASPPPARPPVATTPPSAPPAPPTPAPVISTAATAPTAAAPAKSIFGRDPDLSDNVLGGLVGPDGKALPPDPAEPRGSLDKEIIRRVIRRHINEVKACYEPQLTTFPDLSGRIMVRFTIGATGDVIAAVLENSTMGNAAVESCALQAVRRWQFPKPLGGAILIVSYPFVLKPSSNEEPAR